MNRPTVLYERHADLGASFTDFAGWSMPVRYRSDLAEHRAVREAAGIFDVSHMGEVFVEGPDAAAMLDVALSARISTLAVGRARYSLVLADDGGMLDDVIVYRLGGTSFLIIANAGNRAVVADALAGRADGFDVVVDDRSDAFALLAVQGPRAIDIVTAAGLAVGDLRYYGCRQERFGDAEVLVARTGYTGEDGVELLVPVDAAVAVWDAIMAAGAPLGLEPAGLAARDSLRLEAGMPLYGHELTTAVTPVQAGLGRSVAFDKPVFVGREGLAARAGDDARVLVGLVSEGRRAARAGYRVVFDDEAVGEITSGVLSPTLGHPIALAYLDTVAAAPGTAVAVDLRGTLVPATVSPVPFYRRKS